MYEPSNMISWRRVIDKDMLAWWVRQPVLSELGEGNINLTKLFKTCKRNNRGRKSSVTVNEQRRARMVADFISTRLIVILGYVIFLPKSMLITINGEMYLVRKSSGNSCNRCFSWFVLVQLQPVEPCFRDPCFSKSKNQMYVSRFYPCLIFIIRGCMVDYSNMKRANRKVCCSIQGFSYKPCFLVTDFSSNIKDYSFSFPLKALFSLGMIAGGLL